MNHNTVQSSAKANEPVVAPANLRPLLKDTRVHVSGLAMEAGRVLRQCLELDPGTEVTGDARNQWFENTKQSETMFRMGDMVLQPETMIAAQNRGLRKWCVAGTRPVENSQVMYFGTLMQLQAASPSPRPEMAANIFVGAASSGEANTVGLTSLDTIPQDEQWRASEYYSESARESDYVLCGIARIAAAETLTNITNCVAAKYGQAPVRRLESPEGLYAAWLEHTPDTNVSLLGRVMTVEDFTQHPLVNPPA